MSLVTSHPPSQSGPPRTWAGLHQWRTEITCVSVQGQCGAIVTLDRRWVEPVPAEVMASIDILNTRFCFYGNMYSQDLREQSFADWPFREECNCTPEKVRRTLALPWQRSWHVLKPLNICWFIVKKKNTNDWWLVLTGQKDNVCFVERRTCLQGRR